MSELTQIGAEGGHYDKASEPPAKGNELMSSFLKAAADAGITKLALPDQATQPDCRTCLNRSDCDHNYVPLTRGCTNGDKYQPTPAVVL